MILLLFAIGSSVIAGVETSVGPCTFRLDDPHPSTNKFNQPLIRVHLEYRCSTPDLIYASGSVQLRFCGAERLNALARPIVGSTSNSHPFGQIFVSETKWSSKNFATADSDPYPESGWYVATATYEVCIFNGGAFPGSGQSAYGLYDSDSNKIRLLTDLTGTRAS
jgi:hypothetical protein